MAFEEKTAAKMLSPPLEEGEIEEGEISPDLVESASAQSTRKDVGQGGAVLNPSTRAVGSTAPGEPAAHDSTDPHTAHSGNACSRDTDFESSMITSVSSSTDRKPGEGAESRSDDNYNAEQSIQQGETHNTQSEAGTDAGHLPEQQDCNSQGIAPSNGGLHSEPVEGASKSSSAPYGEPPLIIQSDASLVDGLRALLVHHLKRSVGANTINLSASQAELLEHHLARLASYAQKIVHTLAFATRFLSKQHFEGDRGELESPHTDGSRGPNAAPSHAASAGASHVQQSPAEVARPPRKSLKLNDDEILSLYRSAQMEAAIEADWRGIQGPTGRISGGEGGGTNRSAASTSIIASDGHSEPKDADQEYLRILSNALQQPGRSPRAFTAEIMDPTKDSICCRPGVPTVLNGVMGGTGGKAKQLHGPVGAPTHTSGNATPY